MKRQEKNVCLYDYDHPTCTGSWIELKEALDKVLETWTSWGCHGPITYELYYDDRSDESSIRFYSKRYESDAELSSRLGASNNPEDRRALYELLKKEFEG